MAREEKERVIKELSERFSGCKCSILARYQGIDVKTMNAFRRKIGENQGIIKIYKNTLARRAASEVGKEALLPYLDGPTAFTFAEEAQSMAKVLLSFQSQFPEQFVIKGGIVEGRVIGAEKIRIFSKLPPAPVLLGRLVTQMQGPLRLLMAQLEAPLRKFLALLEALKVKEEKQSSEKGEQS